MSDWVMIGVPSSAGAHHAGQERAPDALRTVGLADGLRAAGERVRDAGNLPGAVFTVDHEHPGGRSLPAVARVADEVAGAVADVAGSGELPLVVGGDCTITIGVIAGLRRRHPDVGLVYLDGDADLGVPDSGGSGIFDSMGVSHLLGRGAPELTGLAGPAPLLDGPRLAIVGADPRETDDAGRRYLAGAGVSLQEAPALAADPAGTAERALAAVEAADSKQAKDIRVLDLREITSFADFFLIASGANARQIQATADEIEIQLKKLGEYPISVEGYHNAEWVLLDYGDYLIHIFTEKARQYYDLERLWRDAKTVAL